MVDEVTVTIREPGRTLVRSRPDTDDEEDEEIPTVTDLTTLEADPETFDRTFLATKENFRVGGAISPPTSFPIQAIPRLAYVLNYNLVFDEDLDRWVPQKKTDEAAFTVPWIDLAIDQADPAVTVDSTGVTVDQTQPEVTVTVT